MTQHPPPPPGPGAPGYGYPGGGPQGPGQPGQGWPYPAPQSSGKATASLVLGICGLVVCPFICSVIGLILGTQARNEIAASHGMIDGDGQARAGVILSWVGLGLCALLLLAVLVAALAGA